MRYYFVKDDETIDLIINKFKLNYLDFFKVNNLDLRKKLKKGDKVILPYYHDFANVYSKVREIYENDNSDLKINICPYCHQIIEEK